ncbi:MAG: response regulator [Nocardioidaceae bacterium]
MSKTVPGGRRVLLVDDDPDIRLLAQMSLSRVGGYEVRAAVDGDEALGIAIEWVPDAILMDVHMPGGSGATTAQALKDDAVTARIPIVMLTASVSAADRSQIARLPIEGVLPKPFDPMTLPGELADLLGWS